MRCCFVLTLALLLTACSKSSSAPSTSPGSSPGPTNIADSTPQDFEGTIANLAISMKLWRAGKELSGRYRYAGQSSSLDLTGSVDENNNLVLNEFDAQGNQTGVFKGQFVSKSEISGAWSKPNGRSAAPFLLKEVTQIPTAKAATPAEQEDFSEEDDDTGANPGVDLDSEARAQFQQLWSSTFTDCGDGTFVTRTQYGLMKQVRNVTFSVQARPITEADTLNNVQWKGAVRAKYSSERNWNNTWDDWKTASEQLSMGFEKRNSRWSLPNMLYWRYQKAPCP